MNLHDLYHQSQRVALWGVVISLLLGILKLFGGWSGHSFALFSDAIHSLGDTLASAGVWGALYWAQRPADQEHPYGHMRVEAVAGCNVALLLILSGIWVGWESLATLREPSQIPEFYTLIIAALSIILNEALYRYSRPIAEKTGSRAVLASSWDQRLDAFGSLGVFVSLALYRWGGADWHLLDHFAAFAVALIIVWAGGSIFWGSLQELMDRQAPVELLDAVRRSASCVPGVVGIEKLFMRKAGLEFLVDIHVEVDPTLTVSQGHAIGHAVKDTLMASFITVKDVLVHIEPAPIGK